MARYLLDTTALIDFSRGREPALSWIRERIQSGDELAVCAVNVAEFYTGVPPERRAIWDTFVSSLRYWEITAEAARRAGCLRHDAARGGRTLSTADALVGAVVQERGAVIVTDNVKDYPMLASDQIRPLRP